MTLAIVKPLSSKWHRIWWVKLRIPKRNVNWHAQKSKFSISVDVKCTTTMADEQISSFSLSKIIRITYCLKI